MQKKDETPSFPQELGEKTASLTLCDQAIILEALTKETPEISRLLVAFATYARAHPHSSNWIHYDKKTIMYLAGLEKLRVQDQQSLTNHLHEHYGLNMQVVGSTQPIPCFRFEWQVAQPPITASVDENGEILEGSDTSNPLIALGALTPTTISNYVKNNKEN